MSCSRTFLRVPEMDSSNLSQENPLLANFKRRYDDVEDEFFFDIFGENSGRSNLILKILTGTIHIKCK